MALGYATRPRGGRNWNSPKHPCPSLIVATRLPAPGKAEPAPNAH
jgi:hypothetical protein